MDLMSYSDARTWADAAAGRHHALLGNGFGMAFDPGLFGYAALAQRAEEHSLLSRDVARLMTDLGTPDFEATMRALESTIRTLSVLDPHGNAAVIDSLMGAVAELREALAQSVAGLHPDRPYDIDEARYRSVRRFLAPFANIYTVNYDLLLYWSLMQEIEDDGTTYPSRAHDDGFRDSGIEGDETVLWYIYDPFKQSVYYLHGALHLFLGEDGLRKITYIRTDEPLIEQTRSQLAKSRYPLYVAESESARKLDRINRSAYLSRGLRSITSLGGSITLYGHSLDANDDHVLEAIVRSKVARIAVSIYGNPATDANRRVIASAHDLAARRAARWGGSAAPLLVGFYDAASASMWAAE